MRAMDTRAAASQGIFVGAVARGLLVFAAACAGAGCALRAPGATDAKATESRAPTLAGLVGTGSTLQPDTKWWRAYGDSALDALVERALTDQPSLATLAARAARADAAVRDRRAAQGPQLGLNADASVQRYSENGLLPPPIAGSTRDNYTVQLAASWEIDFFGRHRAALQSALGQQRAAEAEQQAARTVLAAQVVRGWIALARALDQRQVVEQMLALRTQALELTKARRNAGLDTQIELQQAEAALPDLRQQLEVLDEQAALARNQLAQWSAQPAAALTDATPRLAPLPGLAPPQRLGLDLLGRRAEVVAARWRVEAATQDVALARALYLPDLNLMAFAGFNALGLSRLVGFGSRTAGADAALRLPIFDGGRLGANLDARRADERAAVAAYDAAVLEAVREAMDAIAGLQSVQRQREEQARVLAAAESAWKLAAERRAAGIGGELPVLALQAQWLQQRRTEAELRARWLDAQAQLMRALGGGYEDRAESR